MARPASPYLAALGVILALSGSAVAAAPEPAPAPLIDNRGAEAAPAIDLYTMGEGDDVFSRFGHAALCVTEPTAPPPLGAPPDAALVDLSAPPSPQRGRCYNYGTADFSTPIPLTWDFIRGRARFWVAVQDLPRMVAAYIHADRSVYRQRLSFPPEQARALARTLEAATAEDVRYYRYHHFHDNCTTRLRDHLDALTKGRLRDGNLDHAGPSFRAYARQGFAGDIPLLIVADLLLGRPADQRTSRYQAMFLPDVLRAEVQEHLKAEPEVLHQRAPAAAPAPSLLSGRVALFVTGALLALWLWARRARLPLVVTAVLLGLCGVLLWGLAALSAFPELRQNENLLLFWPSDLLLPALAPLQRRRYLTLRLAAVVLSTAAAALGLLLQPLWAASGLVLPPLLVLWWQAGRAAPLSSPAGPGAPLAPPA